MGNDPKVIGTMSDAEHDLMSTYVANCAAALGITPWWHVEVGRALIDPDDATAHTYCHRLNHDALLHFSPPALEYEPWMLRRTVTHELAHIHVDDLSDLAADYTKHSGGTVRTDQTNFAIEQLIERLARLFDQLCPMPPDGLGGTGTLADNYLPPKPATKK